MYRQIMSLPLQKIPLERKILGENPAERMLYNRHRDYDDDRQIDRQIDDRLYIYDR